MEKKNNIIILGLMLVLISFTSSLYAQKERKLVRNGNKEFENKKFQDSEISYRKALDENIDFSTARFNLGDALYRQKKFEEALMEFKSIVENETDKEKKSNIYHNIGNSLLSSKKVEESIEAYKKALRLKPDDIETKYNLAFAQNLLKQQQQQNKQNQQNQNQDQNKDQQNQKDQNKQDQKKEDQDKNKQDQKKDEGKEEQKKDQQNEQQKQQISKEAAKRLLQALENDEKKVQKKVKEKQAQQKKVKVIKNW